MQFAKGGKPGSPSYGVVIGTDGSVTKKFGPGTKKGDFQLFLKVTGGKPAEQLSRAQREAVQAVVLEVCEHLMAEVGIDTGSAYKSGAVVEITQGEQVFGAIVSGETESKLRVRRFNSDGKLVRSALSWERLDEVQEVPGRTGEKGLVYYELQTSQRWGDWENDSDPDISWFEPFLGDGTKFLEELLELSPYPKYVDTLADHLAYGEDVERSRLVVRSHVFAYPEKRCLFSREDYYVYLGVNSSDRDQKMIREFLMVEQGRAEARVLVKACTDGDFLVARLLEGFERFPYSGFEADVADDGGFENTGWTVSRLYELKRWDLLERLAGQDLTPGKVYYKDWADAIGPAVEGAKQVLKHRPADA